MLNQALYLAATLSLPPPGPPPETLPALLRLRAARHPERIALRHKTRGLWRAITWHELARSVERAAQGLLGLGFAGDALVIAGEVRASSLIAALAALAAGGRVTFVDPAAAAPAAAIGIRFLDDDAVQRALGGEATAKRVRLPDIRPDHVALTAGDDILRHRELIAAAAARVDALALTSDDRAAVAVPTRWAPLAQSLLAEWLLTGLELGLPEDASTADDDVAALAPSYLLAPAAWYQARWRDAAHRLPPPGTHRRAVVDRALDAPSLWGDLLVRGPLRRRLGVHAVRVAATSDGAPGAEAASFYASLGVAVRAVAALAGAHATPVPGRLQPAAALP